MAQVGPSVRVLDSLFDGVYIVDTDKAIRYWNNSAADISGFGSGEVLGHRCSDNLLRHVDAQGTELCLDGCPLQATLEDGKDREAAVWLHHKEGHRVPVKVRVTPIHDSQGNMIGATEVFVGESKADALKLELEALKQEVFLDVLTGAGNKAYFDYVVPNKLAELKEARVGGGILAIDIDNFSAVNQRFGTTVGDAILKMVARTLAGALRDIDQVFHWNNDRFVVFLPHIQASLLVAAGERVRIMVERSFIGHGGLRAEVTISVGASMATNADETADAVVERAFALAGASKQAGGNRVSLG